MSVLTIFGVTVRLSWTWLPVFPLLAWTFAQATMPALAPDLAPANYLSMGVAAAIGYFICVLLREIVYLTTARAGGLRPRVLTLSPLGGVSETVPGAAPRPAPEAAAALAGVLVSVLLAMLMALLFARASGGGTPLGVLGLLLALLGVNGLLALVGLLPAYPLAAGRVLRALVEKRTADAARARRIAMRVGAGIGIAAFLGGVGLALAASAMLGAWLSAAGLLLLDALRSARKPQKGDTS